VRADALGSLNVVHRMIDVDRRRLRLTVLDHGNVVMTARIGVGKAGTPTPVGHFYVREKFHVRGVPLYGPRAIGTSAYAPTLSDWPGGGVVGLHGTNQPGLIPGRPSHGCIRLKNRDILRLYRLASRGTPINIHI
jgi:lipoprotein-anchoring transpeptidase ErfK/SrfK